MKTKIDKTQRIGKQRGGFGIQILYPGIIRPQLKDTGFATIGRIDHAKILPGTLIPMHPHIDDEILTYLRSGKVNHLDSEGITETISNQKLMLMNAGARFFHEELTLEEGGTLEGLQIFIRPEQASLKPKALRIFSSTFIGSFILHFAFVFVFLNFYILFVFSKNIHFLSN